jgi:transcriptional regulator with XRE-family HTH domain
MASVREISPAQIRSLRLKKGYSVDDLAHEIRRHGFKTNGATVSKWERGVVAPRAGVLPALAAALDASIDDLYAEANPDEDEEDDQLPSDLVAALAPLALLLRRASQEASA